MHAHRISATLVLALKQFPAVHRKMSLHMHACPNKCIYLSTQAISPQNQPTIFQQFHLQLLFWIFVRLSKRKKINFKKSFQPQRLAMGWFCLDGHVVVWAGQSQVKKANFLNIDEYRMLRQTSNGIVRPFYGAVVAGPHSKRAPAAPRKA